MLSRSQARVDVVLAKKEETHTSEPQEWLSTGIVIDLIRTIRKVESCVSSHACVFVAFWFLLYVVAKANRLYPPFFLIPYY